MVGVGVGVVVAVAVGVGVAVADQSTYELFTNTSAKIKCSGDFLFLFDLLRDDGCPQHNLLSFGTERVCASFPSKIYVLLIFFISELVNRCHFFNPNILGEYNSAIFRNNTDFMPVRSPFAGICFIMPLAIQFSKIFFNVDGIFASTAAEKDKPHAVFWHVYGSCPTRTTFMSEGSIKLNALNIMEMLGETDSIG